MQIFVDDSALRLVGDFDVRSTGEVREAIYRNLATPGTVLVVDLSEVGSVDVTALRVLAVATRHATRQGRRLRVRGCGPSVRRMMHVSGIVRLLEVERQPVAA